DSGSSGHAVKESGSEDRAARPVSARVESRGDGNERSLLQIAFDVIARHRDQPQTEPSGGDEAFRSLTATMAGRCTLPETPSRYILARSQSGWRYGHGAGTPFSLS